MKGVIFNIFEAFVVETFGADAYDDILDACPVAGVVAHIGPKTYPDEHIVEILGAACLHLGVGPTDALRDFGRFAFPQLVSRFPTFVEGHDDPLRFLQTVDEVIHVEVGKLMEGAVLPSISCQPVSADILRIDYRSKRQLCALFEGLLEGVGAHFKVDLRHRQLECTSDGASQCRFEVTRATATGAA